MSLLVLALLAAAEPLPTLDAFLDGDAQPPRSIDVDAWAARAAEVSSLLESLSMGRE